ncbi:MAG: Type II secretion system protein E [Chlamydiales bacterium]|nr:Type II secretion system protein E [Chlamydiales bacterium]
MMAVESPLQLATELGIEIREKLSLTNLPERLPERVPYSFVRKNRILPIEESDEMMIAASADPLNLDALDELRLMLDKEVKAVYTPEDVLLNAINSCYHTQEGAASEFLANLSDTGEETQKQDDFDVYDLLENKNEAPIVRLLNLILSEAIQQGASDIHFEPFENDLKVRYRIDGVLQSRHSPPREYQSQLLTRIKVLAKLDIAEHRLPQDGRIKLKMGGREIDFRVSTVPALHGERIVLRILDKGNVVLGLDQLGMLPSVLDDFRRLITLSEGIVLVTGPTGSGKTTSLYSALWEIYNEETNIMTIEDPVEYKLKGIAQIAVHPKIGLNFAAGLRHILRQDPDVVMIGEIRDTETADIAIQAALTGHLVFSTLHTNDAASAIPRLIDMGVEPYLLSSTVVGVLAQRLVRRVCPNCRERYKPDEAELAEIGLSSDKLNGGYLYKGRGCGQCFGSGYKGRHGIYELLTIDSTLQSCIAKNADISDLRQAARSKDMTCLRAHGAHLVRAGVTTVAEVLRVSRKFE